MTSSQNKEEETNDSQHQFRCKCGKTYSHQASLYNHKTYHCGKQPQFYCPYCPMRTCRKGNLKSHILLKHIDVLQKPGEITTF